jgi:hypothetical protein
MRKAQPLVEVSKKIDQEVNAEKIKYMFMSCLQNAGQNHNIEIECKSFTNMAELKDLGMTVSNQNYNHKQMKSREILEMLATIQSRILC